MSAGDYAGSADWDPTRWAWEFLSRNQEYRTICEELDREPDPQGARRIAKAFGLKRYKSAFAQYDVAGSAAPYFAPNLIYARVRMAKKDSKSYERQLNVGDVVIRFSLLENGAALDAKLRTIEKLAKKLAILLAGTRAKPVAIRIGQR